MKLKFFRRIVFAAVLALFMGQAAVADTVTEGFDTSTGNSNVTLPDGWDSDGSLYYFSADKDVFKSAKPSIMIEGENKTTYLITPMLQGEFNFWLRNRTKTYRASVTAYACTYDGNNLTLGNQIASQQLDKTSGNIPNWEKVTFNSPTATRVALLISQAYFDDFTYTPAEAAAGPSLVVEKFGNGKEYDFGTVPAGTQHTFNLINQGTEDLIITKLSVSEGFEIVKGQDLKKIEPGKTAEVTVATGDKNAEGALTIETNDAVNSRYVIKLKSVCKVPVPVMEVSPLSLDFGTVEEDTTQEILIKNSGDASLTVSAASDNAAFELSSNTLSIEPGSEMTLKVTFKYEKAVAGANTATVTLSPNVGETVRVEAKAIVDDPNIWKEDFEEGVIPQGWSTTGWTVEKAGSYYGNGTYMAYAGTSGNDYTLTTPRLYAAEGQVLKFEVGKTTDQYDPLTVEYSHDLITWKEIEGSPITSEGENTFKAPVSGYYYLRFKGKYGRVDNFAGFRLALKDHDLSIAGQNIPAKGNQYLEYQATVTVKEMMGNTETATAELYIDGQVMVTETKKIGANETLTITLSFLPEESVENAEAYILLTYAETESIKGDLVNVTIAEAPVWDENGEADIEEGTLPVVVFNYTPVQGWNTISVPFALNDEYLSCIFGESYSVYELKDYKDGIIRFQEAMTKDGEYAVGYPYVVYVNDLGVDLYDTEADPIILEDVKIVNTAPRQDESNGVTFSALFSRKEAGEGETIYELDSDSHSLKATDSVKGFRGYVTLGPAITKVPQVKFYDGSGEETGIESVDMETTTKEGIYNIQGVKVNLPVPPGIYIINGKKMVVR